MEKLHIPIYVELNLYLYDVRPMKEGCISFQNGENQFSCFFRSPKELELNEAHFQFLRMKFKIGNKKFLYLPSYKRFVHVVDCRF